MSGRTTYLAALGLATLDSPQRHGRWTIAGNDEGSTDFLVRSLDSLLNGSFPPPTQAPNSYSFAVTGDRRGSSLRQRTARRLRREDDRVRFDVEILDPPGGSFEVAEIGAEDKWRPVLEHFVRCDGLIYLHDPLRREDTRRYVVGMSQRLFSQVSRQKLLIDDFLPHYLAICVTKFDDPRVFDEANRRNLVTQQTPYDFPEPIDTKAYFETVAEDRVVQVVKNRFAPDRMAYFATSAIGFRPGPDGTVNLDDCSNVELDGEPKIIGELRPMNVLEPLIWLEDRIRSSRRRGPGDDR